MKILTTVLAFIGLLLSGSVFAVVVDIHDDYFGTYNPDNTYIVHAVVGGEEIFGFGFEFIDPEIGFLLTLSVPSDFVGSLFYGTSSLPDGEGLGFQSGELTAGQTDTILVGGFSTASPSNPMSAYFGMLAPDMPPLTELPVNNVPVPAAVWLFGSGLLGLVGVARRKRA